MTDEDATEKADNELRRNLLTCVQILTFAVAFCVLATVYYSDQPNRRDDVDKTKYELKAEVEMSFALPKTLQAETQVMPMGGATVPMYVVYGRDMTDRKIWCATFVDIEEAQAWVQASKVFGRAVKGAVIAQQEKENAVEENTTGSAFGGEPAGAAN